MGSPKLGFGLSPFSSHLLLAQGQRTLPRGVCRLHAWAAMGPCCALRWAALAGCLLAVRGCVTCDDRVKAALQSLENDYLPSHLDTQYHKNVMKRVHEALKQFEDQPFQEESYMGVLGEVRVWEPKGRGARVPHWNAYFWVPQGAIKYWFSTPLPKSLLKLQLPEGNRITGNSGIMGVVVSIMRPIQ